MARWEGNRLKGDKSMKRSISCGKVKDGTLFYLLLIAVSIAGCGTIIQGEGQTLHFTSEPSGAKVIVDENLVGTTPVSIVLKGKGNVYVTFEKEGYYAQGWSLSTETNAVSIIGNALLGGILLGPLFTLTDGSNGALYKFEPNSYYVSLQPLDSTRVSAVGERSKRGQVGFTVITGRAKFDDLRVADLD